MKQVKVIFPLDHGCYSEQLIERQDVLEALLHIVNTHECYHPFFFYGDRITKNMESGWPDKIEIYGARPKMYNATLIFDKPAGDLDGQADQKG